MDQRMPEETIVAEPSTPVVESAPVAPEAVVTPVVPAELVEKIYSYQPKDESGRPLGAAQVIKYKTEEELAEKMAEQNTQLIRLNRKLTREMRLGTAQPENIPDNIERYNNDYEITPRPLTADKRMQLVQDLQDPEKCDQAADELIAARIGDPAQIVKVLNDTRQQNGILMAEKEIHAFLNDTPEYYRCEDNKQTIINWMLKNNLKPIKENFSYAYKTLKDSGLMLEPPVEAPAVIVPSAHLAPEAVTAPVVEPAPTVPGVPAKPVSSGLTREQTSDTGPAVKQGYSQKEIDKMSSDEYRQKVLIPEFNARRKENTR